MALEPGCGKAGDGGIDGIERRQKIPDQNELGGARQRLKGRKAFRLWQVAADQFGNPRQRNAPAHRRNAAAEQGQALPTADEQAGERDQKQFGPVALCRPLGTGDVIRRGVLHRSRGVPPQPHALRGFPLGLADIEPLRFGALAPVDARRRVARFVLAELPECLALADTPTAVHALCHSDRDALRSNKKRRKDGGGLFCAVAQRAGRCGTARQKPDTGT